MLDENKRIISVIKEILMCRPHMLHKLHAISLLFGPSNYDLLYNLLKSLQFQFATQIRELSFFDSINITPNWHYRSQKFSNYVDLITSSIWTHNGRIINGDDYIGGLTVDRLLFTRNIKMHDMARAATVTFLCIGYYRQSDIISTYYIPKDVVKLIARMIFDTRTEIATWSF